jgi:ABC-type antimicrobial peptide transport system permease subunit
MVSFGVALNISQEAMLANWGDISIITVSPKQKGKVKLNDRTIEKIKNLDGVLVASPKKGLGDVEFTLKTEDGRYVAISPEVVGVDTSDLGKLGYKLIDGELITPNDTGKVLFGSETAYQFCDTMRPEGSNTVDYYANYSTFTGTSEDEYQPPDPYFNPSTTKLQLVIGSSDATATDKKVTVNLEVKGTTKGDYNKMETVWGCVMDINQMKELISQYNNLNNLTDSNKDNYDTVIVKVDDIDKVNQVEQEIKKMGFMTSSMAEERDELAKDANQKQLMFAGLGVVSLFVAALGIMNTMIMAITERTREIGVMKSLGCFIKDIRALFLFEAGFIGFIGGIIGGLLSVVVSGIINLVSLKDLFADGVTWDIVKDILLENTSRVSVVPWELVGGAVVLSVIVAVAAGYYPANRAATKISAIEAIKAD